MGEFGKRLDGPGGRRVIARDAVSLPASIITFEHSYPVALLDVSPSGAKIRCEERMRVGEDVWIQAAPVNTLAEIMWCHDGMCGIRFDAELSDCDYEHLRQLGTWTLVAQLSPDEQQAADDWSNGVAR
jgi:hypothetical protein